MKTLGGGVGWNMRLPFAPWHSAPLGRQSCQLSAPAALYLQRNFFVFSSVGGWADLRATECGQKNGSPENIQGLSRNRTRNLPSFGDTFSPSLYTKRHVEHHHVALSIINCKLHSTIILLQRTYIHNVDNSFVKTVLTLL